MISKPERLKGEVKSFEKVIKASFISKPARIEGAFSIERIMPLNPHDEWMLVLFYTQPFDPSMIVELFDGWKNKIKGDYYCDPDKQVIFNWDRMTVFYLWSSKTKALYPKPYSEPCLKLFIPTVTIATLNDFIRDCERAGIKLTWKSGE